MSRDLRRQRRADALEVLGDFEGYVRGEKSYLPDDVSQEAQRGGRGLTRKGALRFLPTGHVEQSHELAVQNLALAREALGYAREVFQGSSLDKKAFRAACKRFKAVDRDFKRAVKEAVRSEGSSPTKGAFSAAAYTALGGSCVYAFGTDVNALHMSSAAAGVAFIQLTWRAMDSVLPAAKRVVTGVPSAVPLAQRFKKTLSRTALSACLGAGGYAGLALNVADDGSTPFGLTVPVEVEKRALDGDGSPEGFMDAVERGQEEAAEEVGVLIGTKLAQYDWASDVAYSIHDQLSGDYGAMAVATSDALPANDAIIEAEPAPVKKKVSVADDQAEALCPVEAGYGYDLVPL